MSKRKLELIAATTQKLQKFSEWLLCCEQRESVSEAVLPPEILLHIFGFLEAQDVPSLLFVCWRWYRVCQLLPLYCQIVRESRELCNYDHCCAYWTFLHCIAYEKLQLLKIVYHNLDAGSPLLPDEKKMQLGIVDAVCRSGSVSIAKWIKHNVFPTLYDSISTGNITNNGCYLLMKHLLHKQARLLLRDTDTLATIYISRGFVKLMCRYGRLQDLECYIEDVFSKPGLKSRSVFLNYPDLYFELLVYDDACACHLLNVVYADLVLETPCLSLLHAISGNNVGAARILCQRADTSAHQLSILGNIYRYELSYIIAGCTREMLSWLFFEYEISWNVLRDNAALVLYLMLSRVSSTQTLDSMLCLLELVHDETVPDYFWDMCMSSREIRHRCCMFRHWIIENKGGCITRDTLGELLKEPHKWCKPLITQVLKLARRSKTLKKHKHYNSSLYIRQHIKRLMYRQHSDFSSKYQLYIPVDLSDCVCCEQSCCVYCKKKNTQKDAYN